MKTIDLAETMKYILILLLCAMTIDTNCQTIVRDKQGNFVKVKPAKVKDVKTNFTLTDEHGMVYYIWKSARGNHFYFKRAKNGKIYKVYIPEAD